jgi:DNA-binding MarR family transcriptional regulator
MPSPSPPPRRELLAVELTSAGAGLGKASAMFSAALAEHMGLHPTEWECVGLLQEAGDEPLTAGRLAELTGLTTGAVTGVLDRLESKGWVTRRRHPDDRRRVVIELVPDRLAGIATALAGMHQEMRSLEGLYDEGQLAATAEILTRAADVLRRHALALRASGPQRADDVP